MILKRARILFGAVFTVLSMVGIGYAKPLKLKPFLTAEIFLPGNAGKGLENDALVGASQLNGIGYDTLTTVETRAAIGFRGGLKTNVSESLDLGVSVGYINGPDSDVSITATAGALSGVLTDAREVSFLRYLIEPTFNARLNERTVFHLGAGLGIAQGKVTESFTCTGNACLIASSKNESSWDGFTWEISPYFSSGKAMYGIRYAAFPSFAGNSQNSKIDWSTFVLFAGVQF